MAAPATAAASARRASAPAPPTAPPPRRATTVDADMSPLLADPSSALFDPDFARPTASAAAHADSLLAGSLSQQHKRARPDDMDTDARPQHYTTLHDAGEIAERLLEQLDTGDSHTHIHHNTALGGTRPPADKGPLEARRRQNMIDRHMREQSERDDQQRLHERQLLEQQLGPPPQWEGGRLILPPPSVAAAPAAAAPAAAAKPAAKK